MRRQALDQGKQSPPCELRGADVPQIDAIVSLEISL
jgi:hypothetical protein